jgi:hypothetical protein
LEFCGTCPEPFGRIVAHLKATAHCLQSWSAKSIGHISLQLQTARELIARFDAAQYSRPLSPFEAWLHRQLKAAYLGLASLERSIIQQRTRFSWLKEGNAGPTFLDVHASHRQQKNRIFSLKVDDRVVSMLDTLTDAAYEHFTGILGSSED